VPSNAYSASKAAQEAIATSYWRSYGLPLIIVNLMNNFGEMQSPDKFPAIVQRKVRAGERVHIHATNNVIGSRFYIHSRNSADAFLFILNNVTPHKHVEGIADKPDRFNISDEDSQISNLKLAVMIAKFIGKKLDYDVVSASTSRPGHDIHYGLSGAKLAALGWKSPLTLETSMRNTVEWYEEHPEWLNPK
jgi:dTDP-glucose 4,6-dehydratase